MRRLLGPCRAGSKRGVPGMRKRIVDVIRLVWLERCAVALLILMVVLFGGSFILHAQTASAPEKPNPGKTSLEKKCEIPAKYKDKKSKDRWLDSEIWAWTEICEGRIANFNRRPGNETLDPRNPKHNSKWKNEGRTLRSDFLRTILTNEPFRSAVPYRGVRFSGADFKDFIDMKDVSIEFPLVFHRSFFRLTVHMHRFTTSKFVSFSGSNFTGYQFNDGRIISILVMSSASINGSLNMRGAEFENVNLNETRIKGKLDMSYSKFKEQLTMKSVSIEGGLFIIRAEFEKPLNLARLIVGSNLDMRGATLNKLDFTGARINDHLRFGPYHNSNIRWMGDAPKLTLRYADVGTLQDTQDAWPPHLELDGFTYKRFQSGEKKTLSERGSDWFSQWLARDKTYSLQPYQHLAGVLRTDGLDDIADDVLYAGREREREYLFSLGVWSLERFKWWRLSILNEVYGYGYGWRSLWVLQWVAILVVLGTIFLGIAREDGKPAIISSLLDKFCDSLDMLLPVIHLREQHYEGFELVTWTKYYFYIHKILGYVLTFFLLAGLTGLTK